MPKFITSKTNVTSESKYLVYALLDNDDRVRYVGMSTSGLIRPKKHLMPSSYNHKSKGTYHIYNWIRRAIEVENYLPRIYILEYSTLEELYDREVYWIKFYREQGADLTNMVEGGPGMLGLRHTEEMKSKMSVAFKGREISENLRNYLDNRPKEQHPMYGKKHSAVSLKKFRECHLGVKLSEEHKAKIGDSQRGIKKGKLSPERVKAMQENAWHKKPIIHESGQVFSSMAEACRFFKVTEGTLRNILKGRVKNSKFGKFEYLNKESADSSHVGV